MMEAEWNRLTANKKNFIFLGEAGCGKSEAAINLSLYLQEKGKVHFFDMDQTKPLFRSRDARSVLEEKQVVFHCEEQKADAPTLVGGVIPAMLDENLYTVLDCGGDRVGARLVGGFAHLFKRDDTEVFYIINPYRPWSRDGENVMKTLLSVAAAARISKVRILANPNLGFETTNFDFTDGLKKTAEYIAPEFSLYGAFAGAEIYDQVKNETQLPVVLLNRYMKSEWN